MASLHITKENFESEVINSDKTVLVDFWASWCGPCKMIGPIVEEVSEEVTDAKICKVNVDEQPDLASRFKVMSIPTLIVFKDGKEVKKSTGLISKSEILELLNV